MQTDIDFFDEEALRMQQLLLNTPILDKLQDTGEGSPYQEAKLILEDFQKLVDMALSLVQSNRDMYTA